MKKRESSAKKGSLSHFTSNISTGTLFYFYPDFLPLEKKDENDVFLAIFNENRNHQLTKPFKVKMFST